eukprot:gnl/Carplike_NY0171/1846_a2507_550.p1 GENE.gnl/Carplike_NY0171/1846_a2507_550~~gnl/Carplike_NY0171/1846_a2507_550.p1  ORF type:complete len:635 (+),score=186.75 gnl/Carplike_NY0171/1846_a2507_550:31-1935(+)
MEFSVKAFDASEYPLYVQILLFVILLLLSGLFSGLNLGLLGLDVLGLQVLIDSGTDHQKKLAQGIYPLRKRGNVLLCTLLLSNVLVNAIIAVISAALFGDGAGTFIATALITIFGEIIPQAICNRYGLEVGYYVRHVVWFFLIVLFIVTFPIAKMLDCLLGEEIGTIYSRNELKQLIAFHAGSNHSDFTNEESTLLAGAIDFSTRTVDTIVTPLDKVFMLSIDEKLDFKTMSKILESGHSRVPVYREDKQHVLAILVVKDLILLDPEDDTPVKTILPVYGRDAPQIFGDEKLGALLDKFKESNFNFCIVRGVKAADFGEDEEKGGKRSRRGSKTSIEKDPEYYVKGVVTFEDVIESLLQSEIYDETDKIPQDNSYNTRVSRIKHLAFGKKYSEGQLNTLLSTAQVEAVSVFLADTYPLVFGPTVFTAAGLRRLIVLGEVLDHEKLRMSVDIGKELDLAEQAEIGVKDVEIAGSKAEEKRGESGDASLLSSASSSLVKASDDSKSMPLHISTSLGHKKVHPFPSSISSPFIPETAVKLYERGVPCEYFSLLLQGSAVVLSGEDAFRSDQGPWSVFGVRMLTDSEGKWVPDFTCFSEGKFEMLRISKSLYSKVKDMEYKLVHGDKESSSGELEEMD